VIARPTLVTDVTVDAFNLSEEERRHGEMNRDDSISSTHARCRPLDSFPMRIIFGDN
jgi:hypothetical protein